VDSSEGLPPDPSKDCVITERGHKINSTSVSSVKMNSNYVAAAQAMNNYGALILAAGDTQNAIAQFSGALQLTNKHIMSNCNVACAEVMDWTTRTSIDFCMAQSYRRSDKKPMYFLNERLPYMYRQAILIPDVLLSQSDDDSKSLISVIVIFNLSLAHQEEAYKENSGALCVTLMKKAIKLYELAFNLYQPLPAPTTGGDALFYMALINNLALAKHALNDVDASEQCFQQLLSALMLVIAAGNNTIDSSLCDGFLRNVSHLISPHTTAPAA
jgi:tetratricopeptide (TPR) repeat protein